MLIRKLFFFVANCVAVLVLDQLTKIYAERAFELHEVLPVIDGFFNLTLAYNRGMAFGLLANLTESMRIIVLVFGSSFMLLIVLALLWKEYSGVRYGLTALGFILGGALGNLYDRAFNGYVVDFIDVFYKEYHWPAFNVADSAICIGVCILLLLRPNISKA